MFESNELLTKFKNQVEILIEQLTKLSFSEQCEAIEFIRNCLENLKISKRKNAGLCYSLRRKTVSEKDECKIKNKKGTARKNKKDIILNTDESSVSANNSSLRYLNDYSPVEDDNENCKLEDENHTKANIHIEDDYDKNHFINEKTDINAKLNDSLEEINKNDNDSYNHSEENEIYFLPNKDDDNSNTSCASFENKRESTSDINNSNEHIQSPVKQLKTLKTKHKFSCIVCEVEFLKIADLMAHLLSHECAPSSCLKCKAIFNNRVSFKYHLFSEDCLENMDVAEVYAPEFTMQNENMLVNKQVLLLCPYCGISCRKIFTLKRHLKESCFFIKRKYQCSLCEQGFISESLYETHKMKHQRFQCNKCKASYWNRKLLREHKKIHGMKRNDVNMYVCQQCKNTFKGRKLYREHREVCKNCDSFPDPVWCKECVMMFRDRYTYKRHCIRKNHVITDQDTTVTKPFVCEKCGSTFASSYGLETHNNRLHNQKATVFSCDQCSYTTVRMTNLARHKNCQHGGEIQKYVCDKCPAILSTSTRLRYHCQSVHSEVKNFTCDICSKSFKLKTQMNRHRLTHSSIKPHNCLHCPKGFRRACFLQRHIRSKHDEHIPKDQLAISLMKFNKNSKKKPSSVNKTTESPLTIEVPNMHKDQMFSLIDVQSGELVTLSVTEMSNNAVINMSDGDLLNGIHIPDLWTNPAGLFSLDPMMQDTEPSSYGMLSDGGPQISQDLLKTLHGHISKETMGDYIPQYLEIDGSHKGLGNGCLPTQNYNIKPNVLSQTILTSDNIIITIPNSQ